MKIEGKKLLRQNLLFYILLFFILVTFDQSTKLLIYFNEKVLIKTFNIMIIPILNYGVAMGFLNNINQYQYLLLFLFILFLIGFFIYLAYQEFKKGVNIVPYVLTISGAVSNVLDRLIYGGVLDFFTVNFIDLYHFPFGNLADVFILSGLFIISIQMVKEIFFDYFKKKTL